MTIPFDGQRLVDRARSHGVRVGALCRMLVAVPSLSGHEGKIAEVVAHEMNRNLFDRVRIDALGNVIGTVGCGRTKRLIDGHMDTVGVGDEAAWQHHPFKGKLEDGRVWGRGACDQKGGLASMIIAGRLIKELGLDSGITVWFVASCQEEDCDGLALRHVLEHERLVPDYAVITEPTGLAVHRGQRGRVELSVVTKGRSCHASTPERGENAVYSMMPIVREIEALNGRLGTDPFLGPGSVAVTRIECRTPSNNALPDECTIVLDRRLTAGETGASAIAQLESLPSFRASRATVAPLTFDAPSWKGLPLRQEKEFPSWVLPEDHRLTRAGVETARLVLGAPPRIDRWVASTNGVATMGRHQIPTIGFGPSDIALAHTPEERVAVDEMVKAAAFYAALGPVLTAMDRVLEFLEKGEAPD
ncbi:MAG: YgeY family selenium metabolism-linked hydrolase [Candidatus Riflebacteria bacterium]|nr:YgeY family selenium metabolism-linked hydrolase [Candidatus Riflebacteria bacterium]